MFRLRRLIKFLFSLIVVGLVLIAIALVALVNFVNPNDYKDKISDLVATKTGRTLVLAGNLSWRFYPWLAVKAERVSLSNAKGFPATGDFASVGEADFSVALLPLFRHVFKIDHLYLKDVNLHLIRSVGGENNWQDLVAASTNGGATNPQLAVSTKNSVAVAALPLLVKNLELKNANVTWQDHTTGKSLTIDGLNFQGKHISFDAPFYFDLNFNFANKSPLAAGSVDLRSTIELDLSNHHYVMHDLALTGLVRDTDFAKNLPYALKADADVDFSKQTLKLANFAFNLANLTLVGAVDGSQIVDAPVLHGSLNGSVKDIQKFLNYFGVRLETGSVLPHNLQAKLDFEYTPKFIKVPNLMVNLDGSSLTGNLNFANFSDKSLEFALNLNQIDADKYLWKTSDSKTNKSAVTSTSSSAASAVGAPVVAASLLPNFKIDGSLNIASLQVKKIKLSAVTCNVTGTTHDLMANLLADLYSGKLRSKVTFNTVRNALAVDVNLNGINLAPLLNDSADFDKVSGIANFSATLNSSGDSVAVIMQHLNGKGVLSVDNGVWHGVDMRYQVNRANAIINHREMPTETNPPVTEFGRVTANFMINNGLISNNDFLMQSPYFHVTGAGTINLNNKQVRYDLDAKGMQTVTDASGNKSDVPTEYSLPIKIGGTLTDLSYQPDYGKIAGQVVKKTATQAIEKALKDRLNIDPDVSNKIVKSLRLDQILQ